MSDSRTKMSSTRYTCVQNKNKTMEEIKQSIGLAVSKYVLMQYATRDKLQNVRAARILRLILYHHFQASPAVNPFRTAVPFWGQSTQISSRLPQKRDCGSERVKASNR